MYLPIFKNKNIKQISLSSEEPGKNIKLFVILGIILSFDIFDNFVVNAYKN